MNTTTIKLNNKDYEIRAYGSNVEIWCDHERKEVIYWDEIDPALDDSQAETVLEYISSLKEFDNGFLPFTIKREAIKYAFGTKIADSLNSKQNE